METDDFMPVQRGGLLLAFLRQPRAVMADNRDFPL
jgi:hypothetical protein